MALPAHAGSFFGKAWKCATSKPDVTDVWTHNRMLEVCHLANIAMRLGREVNWDPAKREIVGDAQANAFLARESRQGYAIKR
jgi:hypothetical protein